MSEPSTVWTTMFFLGGTLFHYHIKLTGGSFGILVSILWWLPGSDQRCFTNFGGCLASWFGFGEARRVEAWGLSMLGPKKNFKENCWNFWYSEYVHQWRDVGSGFNNGCGAGTGVLLSTLHKDSYNAIISLGSEVCISDPTKSCKKNIIFFWLSRTCHGFLSVLA